MFWRLFKASLLVANGFAVLNTDRFLQQYGLHEIDQRAAERGDLKAMVAGFLHAMRYMRYPLAAVDLLMIPLIFLFDK